MHWIIQDFEELEGLEEWPLNGQCSKMRRELGLKQEGNNQRIINNEKDSTPTTTGKTKQNKQTKNPMA